MAFGKKQPKPEEETAALRAEPMDLPPQDDKYEASPFDEKEGVEIVYNLRPEEVKKSLLILQKEQLYKRNFIYSGILAVLFILYLVTVIQTPDYALGYFMLALSAGVICLIWMMAWRQRNAQAKSVTMVTDDFNMTVFDNGILVHQENGDFRALFSEPRFRVRELDDLFLLDLNRQRVYVLPKRCMSEEDVQTVRGHFAGNMVTDK